MQVVFAVLLIVAALSCFFIWHKYIKANAGKDPQKDYSYYACVFFKLHFIYLVFCILFLLFCYYSLFYYFTLCSSSETQPQNPDYIRDSRREDKEEIGWRFCAEVGLKLLRFKDQIY